MDALLKHANRSYLILNYVDGRLHVESDGARVILPLDLLLSSTFGKIRRWRILEKLRDLLNVVVIDMLRSLVYKFPK